MEDLKKLNLTEADFDMMVKGLEELPNSGVMGEFLGVMLMGIAGDRDPESKIKMEEKMERERMKRDKLRDNVKEEVRVLQGKLIMLKRYLKSQGALAEAYDIINPNFRDR